MSTPISYFDGTLDKKNDVDEVISDNSLIGKFEMNRLEHDEEHIAKDKYQLMIDQLIIELKNSLKEPEKNRKEVEKIRAKLKQARRRYSLSTKLKSCYI